jgi:hypothetical protein
MGSELEELFAQQLLYGGVSTPDREVVFAKPRRWRFDFAWPMRKVAVEVEGATFAQGRHTRGSGFEADCEKYAEAAIRGWLVIRVTGAMVKDGRAFTFVERALDARA